MRNSYNETIMKKIQVIMLLSLVMLTSACFTTSTYMSGKKLMSVKQGMTTDEVRSIFGGEPDFRRFENGFEMWEYRRFSTTAGEWTTVLVNFTDGRVTGLDSFADRNAGVNTPPPPVVVTPVGPIPEGKRIERIQVMSDGQFEKFLDKVKFTVITDEQKRIIESSLKQHDFTSAQTLLLLKEIFMSDDKMEMMKKMYPYVTDKQNFGKVINLLSYSGDKDEIRKFIDEYHTKNK